jgi:hypothetical protein
MKPGFICVAGIDPDTGRQIRPVLGHCFTRNFLHHNGGPFRIGAEVDLGPTKYVGQAPAMEDHRIDPINLRYIRRLNPNEFWSLVCKTSCPSLSTLFGPELRHQRDHSCTTTENHGTASLGHLRSAQPPSIFFNFLGRPRASLHEKQFESKISITDFRLCRSDHQTPRLRLIADVTSRLRSVTAILAVGLTRAYRKSPKLPPYHWLQLNNIHLQDDPLGERLPLAPDDDEMWLTSSFPPPAPKSAPPLTMAAKAGSSS